MSSLFKPLVVALHWVLVEFHHLGLSWGLSIIALTIIVRLILVPLTFKQFRSAAAMQAIQPKLKELQKKHKGDKQKLQQETMRLYQEHKVNPFASCLPMLLQLPVFISLYYAIGGRAHYLDPVTTLALKNASFLWLPHLGKPDPYYILLVIYIVSQLVSTELMLTPQTDSQQKWIMRGMPLMFAFILIRFPSGLFVYWVTTNLWTIGQQLIIRRRMPAITAAVAAAPAEGGKPKKRSRFMDAILVAQEQRDAQAAGRTPGKPGVKKPAATKRPGGAVRSKSSGTRTRPGVPPGKKSGRPGGKPGSGGSGAGRPGGGDNG
jgi:YidC/Oxa1 family membrane protein insertase